MEHASAVRRIFLSKNIFYSKVHDARDIPEFAEKIRLRSGDEAGKVVIISEPSICSVSFLDENTNKATDQIVLDEVPAGTHSITFKRGNEALNAEFEVEPGSALEVKGHFGQGEVLIHKTEPVHPVVDRATGPDGTPMVLIPAGEFQMGGYL